MMNETHESVCLTDTELDTVVGGDLIKGRLGRDTVQVTTGNSDVIYRPTWASNDLSRAS